MSAIFHLTNIDNAPNRYAIEQGTTFNWLTLVLDGDFTTWTPRGQIRDRYADDGGVIKAAFSFPILVMGSATLPAGGTATGTIIRPQLTANQSAMLDWLAAKMTKRANNKEQAIPGRNVWVYDIELQSVSGEVIRVVEGYVEIVPEVTR
jgi:hypothetical protein